MPQSLDHVAIHLIFSTKNRKRVFLLENMRSEVAKYMTGILDNIGCPVIRIALAVDHVHVLCFLSRTCTIADMVGSVKRSSSSWIKDQPWAHCNLDFKEFGWQNGYAVFSVSASNKQAVSEYIDNQIEHHKRLTFKDEYQGFLKKHGVSFDEKYMWE